MVVAIVTGFVVLVLAVLLVTYVVSLYNQLVRLDRRADQAKQNIDVLLAQRQDELTKLIVSVEEFMDHEEEVLTTPTEARERAERAATPTVEAIADHAIRDALATFRARVEAYPDLRSWNVLKFQERISDIESQIADRREVYNESVTRYNTRNEQFPYLLFASLFGYGDRELFTATAEGTADVDVSAAFAE